MNPNPTDTTRLAVELLTAWLDRESDNVDAATYIAERMNDPEAPSPAEIVVGQLNLAEMLVLILAKESGASTEELRPRALQIMQQLAAGLSEQP